jgi:hypothetical protein
MRGGPVANLEQDPEPQPGQWGVVALAWLAVGVPLAWGIFTTLKKAAPLFK